MSPFFLIERCEGGLTTPAASFETKAGVVAFVREHPLTPPCEYRVTHFVNGRPEGVAHA